MGERMKDKLVLVTGAGSSGPGWGNGKAAAVLYAREGAKVFAIDLRIEAADETKALIEEEGGVCQTFACDVSKSDQVQVMVQACIDAFGRIDVLHNNVGISETGGAIDASEDSWHKLIAINQTSVFLTCKYVLPHMVAQQKGSIVNVGSVAGTRWIGFPYAAYTATKAAVMGLTQNIALQHAADGIRANCVLPGLMNTPLIKGALTSGYDGSIDDMVAKRDAQSPTGKMGDAWDVAYASLFLASDEAKYVNATQIVVDGGLTARCA
jgi:NAD(P)-dependent dehydrogenase (short-subunit alcohol dehydrogenase family)